MTGIAVLAIVAYDSPATFRVSVRLEHAPIMEHDDGSLCPYVEFAPDEAIAMAEALLKLAFAAREMGKTSSRA